MSSTEIQKIIELLRKTSPSASEQELERTAQNLFDLATFLVRLRIKEYSEAPKPQCSDVLPEVTENPP